MTFFNELGRFNTAFLFLWIGILFVPACKKIKRSEVPAPIVNPSIVAVDDAAKEVVGVSADLGEIAKSISITTDSIEDKDERRQMEPEVAVLREEVPRIENERLELYAVSDSLTQTSMALSVARSRIQELQEARQDDERRIERLQTQITDKDAEIVAMESEADKKSRRLLTLTAMLGVICCAVCAMLMFNGKGGIGLGVFGIALIVGSTAASWIMAHAWICGVAVLIGVGLVVWKIVELCKANRANRELVATTEKIKKYLPDEAKRTEFGDMVGDGEVGSIQSETTKAIVAKHRQRLGGRVAPAIAPEPKPQ